MHKRKKKEDQRGRRKGRKNGSILITFVSGVVLVPLGLVTLASRNFFGVEMQAGEHIISGVVSLVFGAVLLYWVFSYEEPEQPGPNEAYAWLRMPSHRLWPAWCLWLLSHHLSKAPLLSQSRCTYAVPIPARSWLNHSLHS
jgi:succinate dehydrogenase hydrophobic anchor subunit